LRGDPRRTVGTSPRCTTTSRTLAGSSTACRLPSGRAVAAALKDLQCKPGLGRADPPRICAACPRFTGLVCCDASCALTQI
jgi:hypothetical protein